MWQPNEFVYLKQLRFRHPKVCVLIALEKNSEVCEIVRSVLDILDIKYVAGHTTDLALLAWNSALGISSDSKEFCLPNIAIVDTRNSKAIDHRILARYVFNIKRKPMCLLSYHYKDF